MVELGRVLGEQKRQRVSRESSRVPRACRPSKRGNSGILPAATIQPGPGSPSSAHLASTIPFSLGLCSACPPRRQPSSSLVARPVRPGRPSILPVSALIKVCPCSLTAFPIPRPCTPQELPPTSETRRICPELPWSFPAGVYRDPDRGSPADRSHLAARLTPPLTCDLTPKPL